METCLLLSARRYDFKDEAGATVCGTSLTYLTGDVEAGADSRGAFAMTISAPVEVYSSLDVVPGLYDLDFRQRVGKGGRPQLQVVGLKFRAPVDLVKLTGLAE